MATMNVFDDQAFSLTSLSGYVEKMDYTPQLLGELGIFEPMPVRTRNVFVDRSDDSLALIPASADGAPPDVLDQRDRDAISLRTTRLTKRFQLYAYEIEGVRASGTETELQAMQGEFDQRMRRLRADMELTHEHHRLGALQGVVLDADGVTVLHDFTSIFNESIPAATSFELDQTGTDVRGKCNEIVRGMTRSGRGSFTPNTTVHALVGDAFYDALINHEQVRETYLNWSAAADLRAGAAFRAFTYGGITFHNYRGTDDASTVAVPTDEAKFFPVGARDVFKHVMAPMVDRFEFAGTLGQDVYSMIVRDQERDMWVSGELYSYPLFMCQQPRVLRKGTRT